MTSRRRRLLAGMLAMVTGLAVVVGIGTVPASAEPCFEVVDGKIHINPACAPQNPTIFTEINMRARANGQWVTAENAGGSPLIANRWGVAEWEKFGLAMLADGKVALKALVNSRYVTLSDTSSLKASKTTVGPAEKMTLVNNADGSVSLRASNGRFVTVDSTGSLVAVSPTDNLSARFDFVTPPKLVGVIALKIGIGGTYVSAASPDGTLHAKATGIGPAERFKVYELADHMVAFQAANGMFVTAEDGGASPLIANRWGIGEWESFQVVPDYFENGYAAIRSVANGRYVSVRWSADPNAINGIHNGDFALVAKPLEVHQWEQYLIVNL